MKRCRAATERAKFCTEIAKFCTERAKFCTEIAKFCTVIAKFCTEIAKFCTVIAKLCAERAKFCVEFCEEKEGQTFNCRIKFLTVCPWARMSPLCPPSFTSHNEFQIAGIASSSSF